MVADSDGEGHTTAMAKATGYGEGKLADLRMEGKEKEFASALHNLMAKGSL